ncbi:MAG: hypothetical protein GEU78_01000 [Actinobacteria bacterium]|nr:hypothetical protein [Actinomycetota bacterium]
MDEVIARMRSIADRLPEKDGVAHFNRMYLEVTLLVRDASRGHDFEDPRFLELLDVTFANLYFKALSDYETDPASCPRAWVPLFDERSSRRIAPIQFALAGMNAHINRDLVAAIVDTCIRLDRRPRHDSPPYRDFTYVNALLVQAQENVEPSLKRGIFHLVDRLLGRADEVAETWSISRAREAAWVQAETMWALRENPSLSARWLLVLDRTVGFAGRGLLISRPL